MRSLITSVILLLPILIFIPNHAWSADVCEALLKYGTFDSTDTYTDKQKFLMTQYVLKKSKIETYDDALNTEAELKIPIMEVLTSWGGKVSKENFKEIKEQFLQLDFSRSSSSQTIITSIRKFSQAIGNNFEDCIIKKQGFSGWVRQSRNKKAFTIFLNLRLDGSQKFKITQVSAQPAKISCSGGEEKATIKKPFPVDGSRIIVCRNANPKESILLAVNTDRGSLRGPNNGGIELAGTDETIQDLTERVQKLEGRAVPSGMIGHFKLDNCPSGWIDHPEAHGRYLVGLNPGGGLGTQVGTFLADKENRPTGNHTHSLVLWLMKGNENYYGPGNRGDLRKNTYTTGNPNNISGMPFKDGTNAPYIQYRVCIKN